MARTDFTRPLLAPFRLALWGAENLAAVSEATRTFPRFERALSTQLSALLAHVGELNLIVEQVPAPLHDMARELPPVRLEVAAVRRDVEHVSGAVDAFTG